MYLIEPKLESVWSWSPVWRMNSDVQCVSIWLLKQLFKWTCASLDWFTGRFCSWSPCPSWPVPSPLPSGRVSKFTWSGRVIKPLSVRRLALGVRESFKGELVRVLRQSQRWGVCEPDLLSIPYHPLVCSSSESWELVLLQCLTGILLFQLSVRSDD